MALRAPGFPADVALHPLWDEDVQRTGPYAALDGNADADVCIVGAGLTGLWTAAHLLERCPRRRVVVVEAATVGHGASGRNGGWCSALLPMGQAELDRVGGEGAGAVAHGVMVDNLDAVFDTVIRRGLDPSAERGGTLTVARSVLQAQQLRADADEHLGEVWLDATEARQRCGATDVHGALHTPHCAAMHPGRVVHGLARHVSALGATIHEHTPATAIGPHRVVTAHGEIRADHVVVATEAYGARLSGRRRSVLPVYSMMIATEQLPAEMLDQIGLRRRETFTDGRTTIIYGQRTAEGRIAFGGRGSPYHFASAIADRFDHDRRVYDLLRTTLHELFPILAEAKITHHWGGPLGIARDWWWSIGYDPVTGIGAAGGYVGDGLATTHLAGRTLAELIDGEESVRTRQPWVNHTSPRWEPEPLRWLGVNAALRLPRWIDRRERSTGAPARVARRVLTRLTSG